MYHAGALHPVPFRHVHTAGAPPPGGVRGTGREPLNVTPMGANFEIRVRLALRTYAPWRCIVRVVSQTKSRKIPTRKGIPLFFVSVPFPLGLDLLLVAREPGKGQSSRHPCYCTPLPHGGVGWYELMFFYRIIRHRRFAFSKHSGGQIGFVCVSARTSPCGPQYASASEQLKETCNACFRGGSTVCSVSRHWLFGELGVDRLELVLEISVHFCGLFQSLR